MAYADEVLADSPWLYWKLDESSGSMLDASGNGNTGTASNTPSRQQTAGLSYGSTYSYAFNGSSQYIYRTSSSAYSGNYSVEVWMKINSYSNYVGVAGVWNGNSTGNYGFSFDVNSGNGQMDLNIPLATYNGWGLNQLGGYTFSTGVWYHVVNTVNTTTNEVKHYVNGALIGTFTADGTIGAWNTGKQIRFGRDNTNYLNGNLDEVAIYQSVLSADRIAEHYAWGSTGAGASTNIDIAAGTTQNVTFTKLDATVSTGINQTATAPNVTLTGLDASVSAGAAGNVDVLADSAGVTFTALEADFEVTAPGHVEILITDTSDIPFVFPPIHMHEMGVLKDNPWAYWTFQHGDGTDISGNNRHLTNTQGTSPRPIEYIDGPHPGYKGIHPGSPSTNAQRNYFSRAAVGIPDRWTVEFWFKFGPFTEGTNRSYDVVNFYGGVGNYGFRVTRQYARWQVSVRNPANNAVQDTVQQQLTPGSWHHIAITSQIDVGGSLKVVSLFVNGQYRANQVISGSSNFTSSGDTFFVGETYNSGALYNAQGFFAGIDNIAIFDKVLSEEQIANHYIYGQPIADTLVYNTPNVTMQGHDANVGLQVFKNIPVDNTPDVSFYMPAPIFSTPGSPTIPSDPVGITFAAPAPTVTAQAHVDVPVDGSNITFGTPLVNVITRPDDLTFNWIAPDTTEFTARDATTINKLDFKVQFRGQDKVASFRLGNTSSVETNFTITTQSLNADLITGVEYSFDKANWYTNLFIGNIKTNEISDVVYCRLTVGEGTSTGVGSFLVNVEQNV